MTARSERQPGTWTVIRQAATPEVLISCGIGFVGISATTALGPVLGQLRATFTLPYALIGLIGSVFGLARLVVDLPAGHLAGRFDERALTGVGLVILTGGAVLGVAAWTYPVVLAARALMGIGHSMSSTSNLVWLSNVSRSETRTTAVSIYMAGIVTALSVFPLVSGLLAERYGWRAGFAICAVAALVGLALVGMALARGPRSRAGTGDRSAFDPLRLFRHLGRTATLGLVGLYACIFLLMFNAVGFVGTLVPLYGHDVLGLSPAAIGTGLAAASLVGLAVTIPGGVWADRYGYLRILLPGLGGMVVGSLAFLLVRSRAGFVVAATINGLYALSSSVPAALIAEIVPSELRGPAMGIYRLAGDIGVVIGPFVLASIVGLAGHSAAIVVSAALATLVALGVWRLVGPCVAERAR